LCRRKEAGQEFGLRGGFEGSRLQTILRHVGVSEWGYAIARPDPDLPKDYVNGYMQNVNRLSPYEGGKKLGYDTTQVAMVAIPILDVVTSEAAVFNISRAKTLFSFVDDSSIVKTASQDVQLKAVESPKATASGIAERVKVEPTPQTASMADYGPQPFVAETTNAVERVNIEPTLQEKSAVENNLPPRVVEGSAGGNTDVNHINESSEAGRDMVQEAPSDPIAARQAANAALRNSPQFAIDMDKVGVTEEQIAQMWAKKAALGFESPEQFGQFRSEMNDAFNKAGLADADVGLKGTSTTFYSENPGKPLGHHWDADPMNPGDYDLNISSPTMVKQLQDAGISPSEKYGVFKTRDINATFPELDEFQKKWSDILGRDVNFVGYPAEQPRDLTEYILKTSENTAPTVTVSGVFKEGEDAQAMRFGQLQGGGDFAFASNANRTGIEGYFTDSGGGQIPVSLKQLSTDNVKNVFRVIRGNADQISGAEVLSEGNNQSLPVGTVQKTVIYVETPNIGKSVITDYVNSASGNIFRPNAFSSIILNSSDGVIIIRGGKVVSGG
jgi:hypothetical protein